MEKIVTMLLRNGMASSQVGTRGGFRGRRGGGGGGAGVQCESPLFTLEDYLNSELIFLVDGSVCSQS